MPDDVRLIRSSTLAVAPYAYAAVAPPGRQLVVLAGACPLNSDGSTVAPDDYAAQAVAVLDNLEVALSEIGASLIDVVGTRVLVATMDRTDLGTVWTVVADRFGDHAVPSTLVGVTVLGYPDQLVEVEAIAAMPA
ncbi:MAG: RidA family protein [Alphaproteobacteria bacterium]|nr:MAG: RidA family protein [Alphaproteobacteria bacterium]